MKRGEKRRHNRLSIELELVCSKVNHGPQELHVGTTLDISTGGLFFETSADHFEPGHILNVELSIPPTKGLLELGGRLSTNAKVVRKVPTSHKPKKNRIAIQFCQPPQFWL